MKLLFQMADIKVKRKMASRKEKDFNKVTTTLRFRIKDASKLNLLNNLARSVNLVWNYCNETSFNAIKNHNKWLSEFDLQKLTAGSGKELGLSSVTVQAICKEYVLRRTQFKKRKLKWRASQGSKKSLGWIPFKENAVQLDSDKIKYCGKTFRIWLSRKIEGKILSGSFSEDAQGHWYVNLACEVNKSKATHTCEEVGIDLGLKDSAVLSDGTVIKNNSEYRNLEVKLAKAQRANKKKQAKRIHAKIKNKRKDYLHKETTKIAKKYKIIHVGNVSGKFLQSGNGKSSTDASIGVIRNLLKYKAIRHLGFFMDVNESSSTITCSECLNKTGPSGLSGLGVREWVCSKCDAKHHRDTNAALNILRVGRDSLRVA